MIYPATLPNKISNGQAAIIRRRYYALPIAERTNIEDLRQGLDYDIEGVGDVIGLEIIWAALRFMQRERGRTGDIRNGQKA